MNARLLVALLVIAGTSSKAAAFLPNADEAVLRASGMDTRNETLLKFLGEARFNDAQLARLETLILQLGAARFADRTTAFREITRLGPAAELALRKAIDHPDAELRSGARRCLAQRVFQTPPPMLLRLAVRVLVRRQAPGAVSAMLGRLPYAHPGGELETELAFGIDRLVCGSRQMPSELLDALTDAQPARRAIAACIVGSRGTSAQRQRVKPLLNDPVPMVRLRAAQGLLIAADKDAVPVLIALLDATERPEALQAEDLLRWIAGPLAPERKSIVGTGGEMAQQCRRVWDKWWQDQRNSLDMVASTRRPRGPGLFALWDENNGSFSSGIYGCDGNIRFDLSIIGASRGWQVLPNGRLLISGHERRGVAPGGSMLSIRDVDWSGMVHHAYDAPWGVGSNITPA